jgi:hypothetical protein
LLGLLGIDANRLVSGTVTAEQVYIPRATACQDALRNPTEIRLLATELIKGSYPIVTERSKLRKLYPPSSFMMTDEQKPVSLNHQIDDHNNYEKLLQKKNLVLIVRKNYGWGGRYWNNEDVNKLVTELSKQFLNHNVMTHSSDSILHPDFCYACEIIELTTADIIIG